MFVKINRETLMTWSEEFVDNFNLQESNGITDIIVPVLTKVGQNFLLPTRKLLIPGWIV